MKKRPAAPSQWSPRERLSRTFFVCFVGWSDVVHALYVFSVQSTDEFFSKFDGLVGVSFLRYELCDFAPRTEWNQTWTFIVGGWLLGPDDFQRTSLAMRHESRVIGRWGGSE